MKRILLLTFALAFLAPVPTAFGQAWRKNNNELNVLNRRIQGTVMDHTANHGEDKRIWAKAMGQRRDLYVYLPPAFDPKCRYPVILFLHGFAQDEKFFLDIVPWLDEAIQSGQLPPFIGAAPDGSINGEPCLAKPGSFFMNSNAGSFEDLVVQDVWDFVVGKYPVRPEKEAHVLAGVSMGGFAAFNLGIRHRYAFGVVVGIYPPLNLRWVDEYGDYMANFHPRHWGWRTHIVGHEPIGRFYGGAMTLRINQFLEPLYGNGQEALQAVSKNNPIELIDHTRLHNGELEMYVGYGGKDEFNIDAQVESFLYLCKYRGISVAVGFDPEGRHDARTAYRLFPGVVQWLAPRLARYAPKKALPAPIIVAEKMKIEEDLPELPPLPPMPTSEVSATSTSATGRPWMLQNHLGIRGKDLVRGGMPR